MFQLRTERCKGLHATSNRMLLLAREKGMHTRAYYQDRNQRLLIPREESWKVG